MCPDLVLSMQKHRCMLSSTAGSILGRKNACRTGGARSPAPDCHLDCDLVVTRLWSCFFLWTIRVARFISCSCCTSSWGLLRLFLTPFSISLLLVSLISRSLWPSYSSDLSSSRYLFVLTSKALLSSAASRLSEPEITRHYHLNSVRVLTKS